MPTLANFQYAAPEQRTPGRTIGQQADIYALGLILNEMFTGSVPHGTQYRQVADVAPQFAFLDPLIARMLAQSPSDRPTNIGELKGSPLEAAQAACSYHEGGIHSRRTKEYENCCLRHFETGESRH